MDQVCYRNNRADIILKIVHAYYTVYTKYILAETDCRQMFMLFIQ